MGKKAGFTLIELLVVIVIIGILATLIVRSLQSARTKSKGAAVMQDLKSMVAQAELASFTTNNYAGACAALGDTITNISTDEVEVSCTTINNPTNQDVHRRWAATALIGMTIPIQAYSVSTDGVVSWDIQGVNSSGSFVTSDVAMRWNIAESACVTSGGRLPTIEELKTLSDTAYAALGTRTPPGFKSTRYWSATAVPSNTSNHYTVDTSNGAVNNYPTTSNLTVRCVR